MFPNAGTGHNCSIQPRVTYVIGDIPSDKDTEKLVGKERYQDSLKASVKDSFYYEIYLRMVSAPRANILMPLLAITIRKIAERPLVKRQAK